MPKILFWIFQVFVILLFCVNLILYLKIRNRILLVNNLRTFFWYPLVAVFIGIIYYANLFHLLPYDTSNRADQISLIFHYSFLGRFIYIEVGKNRIYKYCFWLFLPIIIYFIYTGLINHTLIAYSITNASLFTLCCFYFYFLFQSPPVLDLLKQPGFWICCGILLGCGLLIPFYSFSNYFLRIKDRHMFYLLGIFSNFGYAIMHIFFIKAYLCLKPLRRLLL